MRQTWHSEDPLRPSVGMPRNFNASAPPCRWCREPLHPVCCSKCVTAELLRCRDAGKDLERRHAGEAADPNFSAAIVQLGRRHDFELRPTFSRLRRVATLQADVAERRATLERRRRSLERQREALLVRRRRYEQRASDLAAARRKLDARRCGVSLDDFLSNPSEHVAALGALHPYQEISNLSSALQTERVRKIGEVIQLLPIKYLRKTEGGHEDSTMTLSQVRDFQPQGPLSEEGLKDLEAALPLLMLLVHLLALYLDVTLPFPCSQGQGGSEALTGTTADAAGFAEGFQRRASSPGAAIGAAIDRIGLSRASSPGPGSPRGYSRSRPCVLQPFQGRWTYFSVHDKFCTDEFQAAMGLVVEDLLCLCALSGAPASHDVHMSTSSLLARLLDAPNLGCMWPASPLLPAPDSGTWSFSRGADSTAGSISAGSDGGRRSPPVPQAASASAVPSVTVPTDWPPDDEDDEWEVVEHHGPVEPLQNSRTSRRLR